MSLNFSPPKFFKIIQNHELQNGQLWVPKKFVEKYWKGIPNPVVITLPNGVQQPLFWVKRDHHIWLLKNWDKIAKFLKIGYLALFKYMGGSCFQLNIFGLNSLEIDYSNFIDQAQFVQVTDEHDTTEQNISRNKFVDETDISSTSQRRKRGTNRGVTNIPSFELTLTRTYAKGYLFRIPCDFSRRYMEGFEGIARIRMVGEDRTWKVEVKYDPERDYSVVKSGWKPFSKEYNLQIGDVCKFKMTRSEPLCFTITIKRASEERSRKKLFMFFIFE
ncbi:unnamed protein product [Trifolium pratense]|uniref:Uncharacterized protein n=1 Tax=Trifolium pratense TaxID=57577 RepID=A0ACB0M0E2_TRIPR|nr:unnamed protein product [Trifolium pratense]